jgi:hypothetical protein
VESRSAHRGCACARASFEHELASGDEALRFIPPAPVPIFAPPMASLSDLQDRAHLVEQRVAQLKEGL